MSITCRKYIDKNDYKRICDFFEKTYLSYGTRFDDNITLFEFQCALLSGMGENVKEIDEVLSNVFLWFDDEELVGILENDSFCIAAEYRFIFDDIIKAGEGLNPDTDSDIEWSIYEGDVDFEEALIKRSYYKTNEYWVRRDMDLSAINNAPALPYGFSIESIPDLKEHDRVYMSYKLCYGILFNKNIIENFYKTSTYRKELDLAAVDPDNTVVALCSGRYDEKNKLVTIEAVSCYHEYRRKGISKALLMNELYAARKLGADKASILTAMPEKFPAPNKLYESAGFKLVGNLFVWKKNK